MIAWRVFAARSGAVRIFAPRARPTVSASTAASNNNTNNARLRNERLVPLDDATLAAIHTLQERASWLIEADRERPVSVEKYQATLYWLAGDLPLVTW
jgi:hypothetical protein